MKQVFATLLLCGSLAAVTVSTPTAKYGSGTYAGGVFEQLTTSTTNAIICVTFTPDASGVGVNPTATLAGKCDGNSYATIGADSVYAFYSVSQSETVCAIGTLGGDTLDVYVTS